MDLLHSTTHASFLQSDAQLIRLYMIIPIMDKNKRIIRTIKVTIKFIHFFLGIVLENIINSQVQTKKRFVIIQPKLQ